MNADRPWAYLMYSAQRQVTADAKAQQLLTSASAVRGRARHLLPSRIRLVGAAAAELVVAFRHEPSGPSDGSVLPQVGHHDMRPLLDQPPTTRTTLRTEPEPWYSAIIDLLVDRGADRAVTTAAVDRLADLFTTSAAGLWEREARRDPVLAGLGLSADQCGALVALMAGSRRFRHNGKEDSLLFSVRSAHTHGQPVSVSAAQQRRIAKYVDHRPAGRALRAPTYRNEAAATSLHPRPPTLPRRRAARGTRPVTRRSCGSRPRSRYNNIAGPPHPATKMLSPLTASASMNGAARQPHVQGAKRCLARH